MSHRFRILNRSRMAITRIRAALKKLRARLQDREGSSLTDALQGLAEIFTSILPKLGKPRFQPTYLAQDADPNPVDWNLNMEQVEEDLTVLFEDVEVLRNLKMEISNTAALARKELEEKANYATSLLKDVRLVSGQLGQQVIVAGDDFQNLDKVDQGFPLQFPAAEVNTLQGSVTLKRTNVINVITGDASVEVTPLFPQGLERLPTPENVMRFYEGRFYAALGEARPEGGRWHLEERVRPGVVVPGDSTIYRIDTAAGENVFEQFPDLRREADQRPQGFPLRPEDILVLDRGAALVELLEQRKRMLDGSPDSFWECEFVIDAPALDQLIADREAEEANVTPQELRARAARDDIDRFDFGVEIVVKLDRKQTVNFISVNPMNFQETAWLEIMEVSTAADDADAFVPIEGFDNNQFENFLTDQANAELGDEEAGTVMAPSRYAYRGQGVYSFPPREASRVRLRFRQRTPVPSEYERVVIQLTRTLSATETSFKGDTPGMM